MVPELPQEIIDKIIDDIALDPCTETRHAARTMKKLSLVSSKWVHRSRTHLFRTVEFTSDNFSTWCKNVRPGSDGPSRSVAQIRYKAAWVEMERRIGPLEGLARSPSHMSAFTNLQTLHFVEISLQHASYSTYFGGLGTVVRELWLEDCQMDINQFVSFIRPFKNLEYLRLIRPQCTGEDKLQYPDMAEPPLLKGTLEFHQPERDNPENAASFVHELSLLPSNFSTIVFRGRLDIVAATNKLLANSRSALTKLTFGHNCEVYFRHSNRNR